MNARELTRALQGRWSGNSGEARCPSHPDRIPSLSIRDGDDGRLLTCCHAGCSPEAVWAALVARGLVGGENKCRTLRRFPRRSARPKPSPQPSPNQAHAIEIWRGSRSTMGTLTAAYLRHRNITVPIPVSIRDHPGLKHSPTALNLPVMIAAITGADRKVTAIQRTFLRVDGRGKANVSDAKLSLGAMQDGAVRLGRAGAVLAIAEGIETGLSAMEFFGLPVWCSLSAARLDRLYLPPESLEIHIFGDNGDRGHEAAARAAKAYQAQGRRVVVRSPPERFGDWNDALQAGVAA